jgi:hypothetical protein
MTQPHGSPRAASELPRARTNCGRGAATFAVLYPRAKAAGGARAPVRFRRKMRDNGS